LSRSGIEPLWPTSNKSPGAPYLEEIWESTTLNQGVVILSIAQRAVEEPAVPNPQNISYRERRIKDSIIRENFGVDYYRQVRL
jgi:hypothetical protein